MRLRKSADASLGSVRKMRIVTPRNVTIKAGGATAGLHWSSGFARQVNARYTLVQKYVDSEVLRLSEPYTPLLTGNLRNSGTFGTKIGSGLVRWTAIYAKRQYYSTRPPGRPTGPLRGPQWFERMKADKGKQIISGAKKLSGGR